MKRIFACILVITLLFCTAACAGRSSNDPNLGTYTAVTGEAFGIEIGVEEFFGEGFRIELKSGGICKLNIDTKSATGKWTLDGDAFTVTGGGLECSGTLSQGRIVLENVADMGINLTLVNPDYKAIATETEVPD